MKASRPSGRDAWCVLRRRSRITKVGADGRVSEAGGRPRSVVPFGTARPPTCILWKRPQHNLTLGPTESLLGSQRIMTRLALLLLSLPLAGCGDVVAVSLSAFPGCAPLVLGDSIQLFATADRANWPVVAYSSQDRPGAFDWESSAAEVITVSERGVIVGRALGGATITARAEGFIGSVTLAVVPARSRAAVSPESVRVRVDDTVTVVASAWDSAGAPIDLLQTPKVVLFDGGLSTRRVYISESRQDGARIVGMGRGRAAVRWTIAGRCGMLPTTVY